MFSMYTHITVTKRNKTLFYWELSCSTASQVGGLLALHMWGYLYSPLVFMLINAWDQAGLQSCDGQH